MKPDTPIKELDALRKEEDALDQSVALNRIVMTMLESKRREDFWLRIVLIISLLVNIVIAGIFVVYESQWTTTMTTTTVTQDTGATVTRSSPAGKTSIGSGHSGNQSRCPTCGRYKTK